MNVLVALLAPMKVCKGGGDLMSALVTFYEFQKYFKASFFLQIKIRSNNTYTFCFENIKEFPCRVGPWNEDMK